VELDEELCLCFHVTRRKAINFIRVEKPRHVSQMSECYGAGSGCGWCRPYLKMLFEQHSNESNARIGLPDSREYAKSRANYVRSGGGTPPSGATPIDDADDLETSGSG
jgi:NAD(P)H-nitrite reductase large subunit